MKVWKIVKNTEPFFGTFPFLRMSPGEMRTRASSGKNENALYAWSARILRSARNRIRGWRVGSPPRFQRLLNSFQAIWAAIPVLPVPVAIVSRIRCLPAATASRTLPMAMSW